MPLQQSAFCLNGKFPGNLQENRILPRFSDLEYSLEHSDGYPYSVNTATAGTTVSNEQLHDVTLRKSGLL